MRLIILLLSLITILNVGIAQESATPEPQTTIAPKLYVDDVTPTVDGQNLSIPVTVIYNGEETTVEVLKPIPLLPKTATWFQWLEWGIHNATAGIEWILLFLSFWLPRVLPTVKDNDLFRIIGSILDKIGEALPFFGFFFRNNRAGGGVHVAYPKKASTPLLGAHVKEWFKDGKQIVYINQSEKAVRS